MTYADYDGYSYVEQEEMFAVGMEAVYEAIRKIDLSKCKDEDAWVHMVVRRKQLNFFNLAQNRFVFSLDAEDPDGVPLSDKVDFGMSLKWQHKIPDPDLRLDVAEALKSLTPVEQTIIELRYWHGWQLKEIGKRMQCSGVNVYYHEQKALEKISKALL